MLDQARAFALAAHGDQMYGARPYSFHLDAVVRLLSPYGIEAQVIGYLHDVVEDTEVSEPTPGWRRSMARPNWPWWSRSPTAWPTSAPA